MCRTHELTRYHIKVTRVCIELRRVGNSTSTSTHSAATLSPPLGWLIPIPESELQRLPSHHISAGIAYPGGDKNTIGVPRLVPQITRRKTTPSSSQSRNYADPDVEYIVNTTHKTSQPAVHPFQNSRSSACYRKAKRAMLYMASIWSFLDCITVPDILPVVSAEITRSILTKSSNLYVEIRLDGAEMQHTSVFEGVAPIWNEEFCVYI